MSKSSVSNFDHLTVFVGGIPGTAPPLEIKSYFARFGRVSGIHIPTKKNNCQLNNGFCYITFESQKSKENVLNVKHHMIGSRRVSCRSYLSGESLATNLSSSNERKLFVKFVPGWLCENQFKQYFEQFGALDAYYMVKFKDTSDPESHKNKSFVGYLVFREQSVCETLIKKKFLKIGNKKMQVERFDKDHASKKSDETVGSELPIPANNVPLSHHEAKPTSKAYFEARLDYYRTGAEASVHRLSINDGNYQVRTRGNPSSFRKGNPVLTGYQLPSDSFDLASSEVSLDSDAKINNNLQQCTKKTYSLWGAATQFISQRPLALTK